MKQLILGGARSGKSALAEQEALAGHKPCIYVATAQIFDDEMKARIAVHQQRRSQQTTGGQNWRVCEAPFALLQTLQQESNEGNCILVDCLGMWLTNLLMDSSINIRKECDALIDGITRLPGDIIFVSTLVSMGITPLGEINRRYIDECGRLEQSLAVHCDRVRLVVAGLFLDLKNTSSKTEADL